MTFNPVSNFANICRSEFQQMNRTCKTTTEKVIEFAEEITFFFKNRNVKPMPDPRLLLVLQKDQTRRKKRKVSKLDGSERSWMFKKDSEYNDMTDEDDVSEA